MTQMNMAHVHALNTVLERMEEREALSTLVEQVREYVQREVYDHEDRR